MKKKSLLFLISSFMFFQTFATTWKTISVGYWQNNAIWQGGVAPPFTCGDTILIIHPIVVTSTITLTTGAHLIVDNSGGICGHQKMVVHPNATFIKYGILELDTLSIPGGYVVFNQPGSWKLTMYGIISNGGVFQVNGPVGAVGPWFDCHMPEYNFMTGLNEYEIDNQVIAYPNPASGQINFKNSFYENGLLRIFNSVGSLILEKDILAHETTRVEGIAPGIYFYEVLFAEKVATHKRKIVITP